MTPWESFLSLGSLNKIVIIHVIKNMVVRHLFIGSGDLWLGRMTIGYQDIANQTVFNGDGMLTSHTAKTCIVPLRSQVVTEGTEGYSLR